MSVRAYWHELPPATRRRLIGLGLVRVLVTTIVLVALYYLLPIDHGKNVPAVLVAGLLILAAFTALQLRIVTKNRYPAVRAVEALATTLPLFLLLFAWAYFTMAHTDPANFNMHPLTRTDTLYFTVTVFITVGVGDISRPAAPAGDDCADGARPTGPGPGCASVRGGRAICQTAVRRPGGHSARAGPRHTLIL